MRTRFLSLLGALALASVVGPVVATVAAPVVAAVNCDDNDPYVVFYEDANYSGSTLVVCDGQNYPNLADIPVADGECTGANLLSGNEWANCISSARAYNWTSLTRMLCVFPSSLYGPTKIWDHNRNEDDFANAPSNDNAHSLRWWNDTTSPYTCP